MSTFLQFQTHTHTHTHNIHVQTLTHTSNARVSTSFYYILVFSLHLRTLRHVQLISPNTQTLLQYERASDGRDERRDGSVENSEHGVDAT